MLQWNFYTDASGKAVLAPRKVVKDGAVVDLASTPDAYVIARNQAALAYPPAFLNYNYAVSGKGGLGQAL